MSQTPPALTEHEIATRDGTLFAVDVGQGVPILMLHGWPLDHRMFEAQIRGLSDRFRIIALDRRGFGRSTAPADMSLEPEDIDTVLDALELDAVHLLGVSQGGRVALRFAVKRPGRLRSLLLQGAVVDGLAVPEPRDERVDVAGFAEKARRGQLPQVIELWLNHPMMTLPGRCGEQQRLLREILADYTGLDLVNYDPEHYRFDSDVLAALERRPLPILLLTGVQETESRKLHAREILHRVPGAREVFFQHSGHLSNLTEPQAFNEAVANFCGEIDSRAN